MKIEIGRVYRRLRGPYKGQLFTCTGIEIFRGKILVILRGKRVYKIYKRELEMWFGLNKEVVKLNWK